MWDDFESKLVKVVDKVTPLTEFINGKVKTILHNSIKHKINKRKKLLNQRKRTPSNEIKQTFNSLNAEIKTFYFSQKSAVRKYIKNHVLVHYKSVIYNLSNSTVTLLVLKRCSITIINIYHKR